MCRNFRQQGRGDSAAVVLRRKIVAQKIYLKEPIVDAFNAGAIGFVGVAQAAERSGLVKPHGLVAVGSTLGANLELPHGADAIRAPHRQQA